MSAAPLSRPAGKRRGEWRIALRRLIMDWRFFATHAVRDDDGYVHGTWDRSDISYSGRSSPQRT